MVNDQRGMARITVEINTHLTELNQLVNELATYEHGNSPPNPLMLRAFGSILHDFYTGTESIFMIIADEIDGSSPTSSDWHRRLLGQVAAELPDIRPAVISAELKEKLDPYRGFRHVFRNVYGRRLDWKRIEPLLTELPSTYAVLKDEITTFLDTMNEIVK